MIVLRLLRRLERGLASWARSLLPGPARLSRAAAEAALEHEALRARTVLLGETWLPTALVLELPEEHELAARADEPQLAAELARGLRELAARRGAAFASGPRLRLRVEPGLRRPRARGPEAHEGV